MKQFIWRSVREMEAICRPCSLHNKFQLVGDVVNTWLGSLRILVFKKLTMCQ